jgi:hypothetical protein
MNGGAAPLTITTDLKRGGWTPSPAALAAQDVGVEVRACTASAPSAVAALQIDPTYRNSPQTC